MNTTQTTHFKTESVNKDSRKGFSPRMLILDDDPIASAVIRKQLQLSFPEAVVDIQHDPQVLPGYDVYLVDNDFNGKYLAGHLVKEARSLSPSALIVSLSSTLDLSTLYEMVNDGCNAVFDKGNPHESWQAKQVIRNYLTVLSDAYLSRKKFSVVQLLFSLKRLLKEWNTRLAGA